MRKQIRITQAQVDALESLAAALNISGQRGSWFQPLVLWLAETADKAMAEAVASLEIAAGCAAGGDWYELVKIIEPDLPAEQEG